jgi:hypothetical protein
LEKMIEASGLAPVIARGLFTRSLADGGCDVNLATIGLYERALPKIHARLKAYCPPADADAKLAAITAKLAELRAHEPRGGTPALGAIRPRLTPSGGVGRPTPLETPAAPGADDDITEFGRRWTADELAVIESLKKKP